MKNLSFKSFMMARSKYFLFIESPHWVGMLVYLIFGMSYGVTPGGSVPEGIFLSIVVICVMFYWWRRNNSKSL